jgi:hypothetical protein
MSVDQSDDDEYVAGDPERTVTAPTVRLKFGSPRPQYWQALTGNERIAVVRWLKRGDAGFLLRALALNTSSLGLRAFVAEALAGGPNTGWRMRLAAQGAAGGSPRKIDRETVAALRGALADGGSVSRLAARLAGRMKGERARRGPVSDPMQVAMVGLAYYAARGVMVDAESARRAVHRFYGLNLGDKNIQRLIAAFNKSGTS